MKLYSLNIIINDSLVNTTSPILYRMENNDVYDIHEICNKPEITNIINDNIDGISSMNDKSYISAIYYDTDTDEYNVERVFLSDIIDATTFNDLAYIYIYNLTAMLYELSLHKKPIQSDDAINDIASMKHEMLDTLNITNDTYCNCIMSMINEDIEKSNDEIFNNILTNIKKKYNELLNL